MRNSNNLVWDLNSGSRINFLRTNMAVHRSELDATNRIVAINTLYTEQSTWEERRLAVTNTYTKKHQFRKDTEKSPGELRRLAVSQTSVKDHQLTLVWKAFQEWKRTKNVWNMKVMALPIVIYALGTNPIIAKGTGRFGNKRISRDDPD